MKVYARSFLTMLFTLWEKLKKKNVTVMFESERIWLSWLFQSLLIKIHRSPQSGISLKRRLESCPKITDKKPRTPSKKRIHLFSNTHILNILKREWKFNSSAFSRPRKIHILLHVLGVFSGKNVNFVLASSVFYTTKIK